MSLLILNHEKVGSGFVICDDQGGFVATRCVPQVAVAHHFMSKALACREGLEQALAMGHWEMILQIHCANIVDLKNDSWFRGLMSLLF